MRTRRIIGWTAGGIVVTAAVLFGGVQTALGKRLLAEAISSPSLEVTGITGFLPTDMQIAKVEMHDKQGAWLMVEDAQARWSLLSLFTGRMRIDAITAHKVEVLRSPLPDEKARPSSGDSLNLPFGIDLGVLTIDDLHLGVPLGGVDSHWKIAGSALLAAHAPCRLKLGMSRTDGPAAKVAADLGFNLDPLNVDGTLSAEESTQGGVIAALIGRPDLDRVSFKLVAKGGREGSLRIERITYTSVDGERVPALFAVPTDDPPLGCLMYQGGLGQTKGRKAEQE